MLDDRSIFVTLAESGSFARAARQLGVSRSTVMRRVDALESALGLRLIQRTGRRIVLTTAGQRYAEAIRPLLVALSREERRLVGEQAAPSGPLRVWLPILGTGAFLPPAVAEFYQRYPAVVVHLELGRDVQNLELDAFDVALQVGFRSNPGLMARTIFRERMILIASRAYVQRNGAPTSVGMLSRHRAIHELNTEGRLVAWRAPTGERVAMPPPCVVVNSVGIAFAIAQGGAGIARVPSMLAAAGLASGALVQVLPDVWTEEPINLVFLPEPVPVVRAFVDFMVERSQRP